MICKLTEKNQVLSFSDTVKASSSTGKLLPKDGKTYHVVIIDDNPDIQNIKREVIMTEHALREYEKKLPFGIKVYNEYDFLDTKKIDVKIHFIDPKTDSYMTPGTLAYAGYPIGSLRGIIRFNNDYVWLDGHGRLAIDLFNKGLIKAYIKPDNIIATYNYKQTVKHEFGHILGLEHNDFDASVMGTFYDFDNNLLGQIDDETLDNKYGLASKSKQFLRWLSFIGRSMIRREDI
jgi:hypothetical protein